jgi:hypothetical protein
LRDALSRHYIAAIALDDLDGLQTYLRHPTHIEMSARFGQSLTSALVYDLEIGGIAESSRLVWRRFSDLGAARSSSSRITWRRAARLDDSRERTFDSAGVEQDLVLFQGPPRVLRIALEQLAVGRQHARADLLGR